MITRKDRKIIIMHGLLELPYYRFIRLSFDKITDVRNMQIFDKVYQTGVSGDLRCCTYLADTDMLRCLTSVKNSLKSNLFSFLIGTMSTLNGFV